MFLLGLPSMLPCCLHGPSRSTKNPMIASKWHHRWDPRPEYLKTGWNISQWQTDKQQQNTLCSATIWPWLTSAFSIMSLSLQAPPCVLAHLWGWLRKHDLRYASVTETPHPPACITDLMAPWGVVSFLCRNHFPLVFFFHPRLSTVKPSWQAPTGNNRAATSSVLRLLHRLDCSHEQECVGVVCLITQM